MRPWEEGVLGTMWEGLVVAKTVNEDLFLGMNTELLLLIAEALCSLVWVLRGIVGGGSGGGRLGGGGVDWIGRFGGDKS